MKQKRETPLKYIEETQLEYLGSRHNLQWVRRVLHQIVVTWHLARLNFTDFIADAVKA